MDNSFVIVSCETDLNDALITVNRSHGFIWILAQPFFDSSLSLGLTSSAARLIADGLYEAARQADESLFNYSIPMTRPDR